MPWSLFDADDKFVLQSNINFKGGFVKSLWTSSVLRPTVTEPREYFDLYDSGWSGSKRSQLRKGKERWEKSLRLYYCILN